MPGVKVLSGQSRSPSEAMPKREAYRGWRDVPTVPDD